MITALDTSVILDVLVADERFSSSSEQALRKANYEGKLVICECVLAELYPAFSGTELLTEFLTDWNIEYSALDFDSAKLAGKNYKIYLGRGGGAKRVVPDFLIGAHARIQADRLLARDRGYLQDYFKELTLIDPSN
jgi:predicted nucleic acid-binding protein